MNEQILHKNAEEGSEGFGSAPSNIVQTEELKLVHSHIGGTAHGSFIDASASSEQTEQPLANKPDRSLTLCHTLSSSLFRLPFSYFAFVKQRFETAERRDIRSAPKKEGRFLACKQFKMSVSKLFESGV